MSSCFKVRQQDLGKQFLQCFIICVCVIEGFVYSRKGGILYGNFKHTSPEHKLTFVKSNNVSTHRHTNAHMHAHTYTHWYKLLLLTTSREREMFYLTMHSTHFVYNYMASDSEKGNPLPPHRLLLLINSKGSFICTIPQKGYHSLCYTSRGALAGTRNSSMGPPHEGSIRRRTMSERSTSELRPAP